METWLLRRGKACPVCRYVHLICSSVPCSIHLATPVFLSMPTHYSASRYRRMIRIRLRSPQRSPQAMPSRNHAERSSITPLVLVCLLKSTRWKCAVAMGRRSIRWFATYCTFNSRTRAQRVSCFRPGKTHCTVRIVPLTRIRSIDDSTSMKQSSNMP